MVDPRASLLPAWSLQARPSPLPDLSSPPTPMPLPTTLPNLQPTQPLNISRRRDDERAQLRDREPLPPPMGSLPPPPQAARSTALLPATTSAVPPPRITPSPAGRTLGLGITAPQLPSLQVQTTFPSSSTTPSQALDRSLLSPLSTPGSGGRDLGSGGPRSSRPSSRRALTRALELAQEAVEHDKTSEAQRAVDAYGKSVSLLSEVMERVMRGADDDRTREREGRAGGRRRSVVARDEEVRRLKAIHDTYADRMRILCILHNIAPAPTLPAHVQALRSPQTPTFPPEVQPPLPIQPPPSQPTAGRPESQDATAIGSTFVSLGEDDAASVLETPSSTTAPKALSPAATQARSAWHTRAASSGTVPSLTSGVSSTTTTATTTTTAPPPTNTTLPHPAQERPAPPPRSGSTSAHTLASQRTDLPPARPPPVVALPPLPAEARPSSRDGAGPKKSPPLHGSLRHQQSLGSLRPQGLGSELKDLLPEMNSPATPTPPVFLNTPTPEIASPTPAQVATPRKITTRSTRSSSLSMKSGVLVPPVPPLPPMPLAPAPPQAQNTGASPLITPGSLVSPSTAQGSIAQRRRGASPQLGIQPLSPPTPTLNGTGNGLTPLPSIPALPTIKLPSAPVSQTATPIPGRPQTQPAPSQATQAQGLRPPAAGTTTQQGRMRAVSQPGARPSISGTPGAPGVPALPGLPVDLPRTGSSSALSSVATTPLNQALNLPGISNLSIPSTLGITPAVSTQPSPVLLGNGVLTLTPSTPQVAPAAVQVQIPEREREVGRGSTGTVALSTAGMVPLSPLPMPSDLALRPFHIMRALLLSILHPPGFYLTPRLFIPTTLWSQGGAKLEKLPQKTSVLLTLGAALEELQRHSDERERERRGGWAQEGADSEEHWQRALVNWERVCEGVRESTRGKGGFAGIQQPGQGKTGGGGIGWGRLGKQWDKVTGGKNLDSPAAYVQSLTKVFQAAPVIENHLRALLTPNAPSSSGPLPQYDHLSPSQRAALDRRLRISSEFFATAVVPFVVRDLGLLMEKYLKKGEKWLME